MKPSHAKNETLSEKELDTVSGGKKRVEVTKEQFEQILEVQAMFASLKK